MSDLVLRDICKDFGHVRVLHDINLDVAQGEFVALVGPSGCGKSTLLSIIAGLEEATSGDITIDGEIVNDHSPRDRNIAMVFQTYALYPTMTVRENLTFGLSIRRVSAEEKRRAVAHVAELLDIAPLLDRKPSQLSGGQRQRVAMGRALVRDPSVFLFDEPLSNLDAKLRVRMRGEIKKLHQRVGTTTVYVTHDQTEAMTLATRIAVMRDGRVQQFDTPDEIYERPANTFVASFIGTIPMNLVPVRVEERSGRAVLVVPSDAGEAVFPLAPSEGPTVAPGPLTMGLRSEHLTVGPVEARSDLVARVDIVEPLGGEALLTLDLAGSPIVTRVESYAGLKPGDRVGIDIALRLASFFDAESGARTDLSLPRLRGVAV